MLQLQNYFFEKKCLAKDYICILREKANSSLSRRITEKVLIVRIVYDATQKSKKIHIRTNDT